jgi:hypothetical protein
MKFDDIGNVKIQHLRDALSGVCGDISPLTGEKVTTYFNKQMFPYNRDLTTFKKRIKSLTEEDVEKIKNEVVNIPEIQALHRSIHGPGSKSLTRVKLVEKHVKYFANCNSDEKMSVCEIGTCWGLHTIKNLIDKQIIKPTQCSGLNITLLQCYFLAIFGIDMFAANILKDDISEIIQNKQDLIIMTEVIEHMPNEKEGFRILKNAINLLKKQGSVIISYPIDASPIVNSPGCHQYQPKLTNITNCFKDLFEITRTDSDGRIQMIIFEKYKE